MIQPARISLFHTIGLSVTAHYSWQLAVACTIDCVKFPFQGLDVWRNRKNLNIKALGDGPVLQASGETARDPDESLFHESAAQLDPSRRERIQVITFAIRPS
jgi:hypothetical protein